MEDVVLKVDGLYKSYNKEKSYYVKDVNFEIKSGQIVGLVGKNGAGKSTIIKSITGILPFEKGSINIMGHNIKESPLLAKQNVGFVPDVCYAFSQMTGLEYINFIADIFGVSKKDREQRLNKMLEFFPLGQSIHKLIASYSHGMKQKVSIMASLISNPKLWILDEPITGLDPQTSFNLIEYMKNYAKEGNAVLFSSHNLDIVEKLCDSAIVINNGKEVANINIGDFKNLSEQSLEEYFMELVKWK